MARHSRASSSARRTKAAVAYIVAAVLLVALVLAVIYAPAGAPRYPALPSIGVNTISALSGSGAYSLASNSPAEVQLDGSAAYQYTRVFLYRGYNASAPLPASISVMTMEAPSDSSALNETMAILFGNIPNGDSSGYVQNTSNLVQNSTTATSINGVNATIYSIYLSTEGTGLPLYLNTSTSPPVYEYLSIFSYGRFVGEAVSYAQRPMPAAANLTLSVSEALFAELSNSTK